MTDPRPLALWSNDCDTVIAHDREDAIAIWAEHIGENPEYYDPEDWIMRSPDERFELTHPDEPEKESEYELPSYFVQKYGRGYLASTDF